MRVIAPLLAVLILAAVPATADPRVRGLRVSVDGRRVLVDFQLEDAFDEETAERVGTGLPTTFVYELELLRDRKRWFDRPLDSATVQVVALFDAVSREYLVNYKLNGKLIESRMVRDLDELRHAMTRFDDIPAFDLEPLPRRWRLLVKVRALLGPKTWLGIIPTRVSTDWNESHKFMAPEELMPPR